MKRMPAVAGQFYSGDKNSLEDEVKRLIPSSRINPVKAVGVISPHAGLIYSGSVAAEVFSRVQITDTVIIIGPNHRGIGKRFAIDTADQWVIPTNIFEIDQDLAQDLLRQCSLFSHDSHAHTYEHSLEVQLPFIAHLKKDTKILPICVMDATLEQCKEMGEAIAVVIKKSQRDIMIVASSDMSHYVSVKTAKYKDNMAIEKVLALDPEGLYEVVHREKISMCGIISSTIMLFAALSLDVTISELVKYTTSGEVSGDYDQVVGYAGIMVR
ncbi:MAG: AmmeMemoRadiSam system protein B [Nitrospirae bacterium]|nr:AmmeMemoRadiSam system protein B [Nitrospirota bacterium]